MKRSMALVAVAGSFLCAVPAQARLSKETARHAIHANYVAVAQSLFGRLTIKVCWRHGPDRVRCLAGIHSPRSRCSIDALAFHSHDLIEVSTRKLRCR